MGFQERNAWACLVINGLIFGPYFFRVWREPELYLGHFIGALISLCILLVGFQIANALLTPEIRKTGDPPRPDERDRGIEWRAAKASGLVLGFCVVGWLVSTMVGLQMVGTRYLPGSEVTSSSPVTWQFSAKMILQSTHMLFAGFVFSNLVYYAAIVWGYRRSGV
jgi:hypothetical protein